MLTRRGGFRPHVSITARSLSPTAHHSALTPSPPCLPPRKAGPTCRRRAGPRRRRNTGASARATSYAPWASCATPRPRQTWVRSAIDTGSSRQLLQLKAALEAEKQAKRHRRRGGDSIASISSVTSVVSVISVRSSSRSTRKEGGSSEGERSGRERERPEDGRERRGVGLLISACALTPVTPRKPKLARAPSHPARARRDVAPGYRARAVHPRAGDRGRARAGEVAVPSGRSGRAPARVL